jgi:hypothetical protein
VDYAEYGGAPLIGLDGLCVIGHGRSSAKAVRSAITMTTRLVSEGLLDRLGQQFRVPRSTAITAATIANPEPEPGTPNLNPDSARLRQGSGGSAEALRAKAETSNPEPA